MKNLIFTEVSLDELREAIIQDIRSEINQFSKPIPPPHSDYITRKEARDLLSISFVTLNTWVKEGVLKAYRVQNRVYFKRSEVEASFKPVKS